MVGLGPRYVLLPGHAPLSGMCCEVCVLQTSLESIGFTICQTVASKCVGRRPQMYSCETADSDSFL
jgi:hypothetical protein